MSHICMMRFLKTWYCSVQLDPCKLHYSVTGLRPINNAPPAASFESFRALAICERLRVMTTRLGRSKGQSLPSMGVRACMRQVSPSNSQPFANGEGAKIRSWVKT